jgi:hypothetical protein
MVAMNSIPQQEVVMAKSELAHVPTTSFRVVAKNPPTTPSGGSTIFMLELIVLYFELENLNHEPYKLILIQCL